MSGGALTLILLDGRSSTRVDDVVSFVGADASGQFGVLPGHVAMLTVLEPGLFRYRTTHASAWTWGACLGGLLSCAMDARRDDVSIVSRRFLQGDEPEALQTQLDQLLQREGALRLGTRESQARIDFAFYKRMQELAQTKP
jgi:F-type H+-transporting ATPase subunit epsilon